MVRVKPALVSPIILQGMLFAKTDECSKSISIMHGTKKPSDNYVCHPFTEANKNHKKVNMVFMKCLYLRI